MSSANNRLDSLDPDQNRDIVGPDLDTNNLHCDNVPEIIFLKVSKHEQIPSKSFTIYEFVLMCFRVLGDPRFSFFKQL